MRIGMIRDPLSTLEIRVIRAIGVPWIAIASYGVVGS
jgi:hypothetical protein